MNHDAGRKARVVHEQGKESGDDVDKFAGP